MRKLMAGSHLFRYFLRAPYPLLMAGAGALIVLALLAGFVPGSPRSILRMPIRDVSLPIEDDIARRERRPLDSSVWKMRAELTPSTPLTVGLLRAQSVGDAGDDMLFFSTGGVSLLTVDGPRELTVDPGAVDVARILSDDTLLMHAYNAIVAGEPVALCVPDPGAEWIQAAARRRAWLANRTAPFSASVSRYAKRFNLNKDLVYAIMYTESGFNPRVISHRFAHGLMQVVPDAAGGEVYAYLHGTKGQPSPSQLLNPEFNIQYGLTYLHLLFSRHMSGVTNPLSREYCVVAAYNIGPNALLKVFGKTREEAFAAINRYEPSELFSVLQQRVPSEETRAFLRKVIGLKNGFASR